MKLSANERNAKISLLLTDLFREAGNAQKVFVFPQPFSKEDVERLFLSHIWGHREIVLTILLARLFDPAFKASKDFYACNPRSIYEKPIRTLLRANGIPHKKSGPLNVAKNSQRIDKVWAHNKRGDGMALVVAKIVKNIETVTPATLRRFAIAYTQRYLMEATKVVNLNFKVRKSEDAVFLSRLCVDLIENVPDGGSVPQFIIGTLIEKFNEGNGNLIKTTGYLDSVSATNTTTKKAGDITEEFQNSKKRIYEITVKKFSIDRIIESYEAIKALDKDGKINEVFVICTKKDVPEGSRQGFSGDYLLGVFQHQDIIYYFINILEWITEKILFMPLESRSNFYTSLIEHINDLNTSEKLKRYFIEWHAARP